jgi:multiple sugar transport system ATP-binding protein
VLGSPARNSPNRRTKVDTGSTAVGHQKRLSGLVMRLPPGVEVSARNTVNIGVRRELLHFFDLWGDRTGAGFR